MATFTSNFNIPQIQNPIKKRPFTPLPTQPTGSTRSLLSSIKSFFTPKAPISTPQPSSVSRMFGDFKTTSIGGFTVPSAPFGLQPTSQSQKPTGGFTPLPAKPTISPFFDPRNFAPPVTPQVKNITPSFAPAQQQQKVAGQTYTLPSGAVVDAQGKIISQPPQKPTIPSVPSPEESPQTPQVGAGATQIPEVPQEPTPDTEKAILAAEKAYQDSLRIGPEEFSTQEDLDKLIASTRLGISKIRNQPIPLDLLIGQSQALERQALDLAEPLERKLSRLQAARVASQDASKFALERADEAQKRAREDAQIKEKEGFSLSEGQLRFDAFGNIIARGPVKKPEEVKPVTVSKESVLVNPLTGEVIFRGAEAGGEAAGGAGVISDAARSWADLINTGKAKISDVPSKLENEVATLLSQAPQGTGPQAQRAVGQADTALRAIDEVLASSALNASALSRTIQSKIPGTDDFDMARSLDTVKALIGFDQLQKMREASPTGGALGQVSERELGFLQTVAGSLDIGQSSTQLKKNLEQIRESFEVLKLISSPDGTIFNIEGKPFQKKGDQLIEVTK